MKFQNMIRTQLVVVGIGAALMFAGTAKSQEIENSTFSDGPNVVAFAQPTAQDAVAPNTALAGSQAVRPTAAINPSTNVISAQQASLEQQPPTDTWLLGTLLACIGAIALYALTVAKRVTRELHSRSNSYISTPGA